MKRARGFKVDIVIWTKDSARFLPFTVKRIDEIIPHESINQKMIVDDHSQDNTVNTARDFNWNVYLNPKTGISSGANEALRHVSRMQPKPHVRLLSLIRIRMDNQNNNLKHH